MLIASAVVVGVIAVALGLLIVEARGRVLAERASSVDLAERLVTEAIRVSVPAATDPLSALAVDLRDGPKLRHIHLFVVPLEADKVLEFQSSGSRFKSNFLKMLLIPERWENTIPVMVAGQPIGAVAMIADPDDELAEIGEEFVFVTGLLLTLTAIFLSVVWWSVSRAMHPLTLLQAGLGRLQHGDFTARLPSFAVPELQPISATFNSLAEALERASRENRFLIGKLLSVQESERADLARDFHDDLGPCLFGIKTEAACLGRNADALRPGEARAHATAIAQLVEDVQQVNRRILGKLRPLALADLGAAAALARLVEDWRERAPRTAWNFTCGPVATEPSEAAALALYRVAQEALTNTARHAGATVVEVMLSCTDRARLLISDNGQGLRPGQPRGLGLLGIAERVQALGGDVRIENRAEGGLEIEVSLPMEEGKGP